MKEVDRLMDAAPDLEAESLAARQLAAVTAQLGRTPTLDELRCLMMGASYVIEVGDMVLNDAYRRSIIRKTAEAAMAVCAWNIETRFQEELAGG